MLSTLILNFLSHDLIPCTLDELLTPAAAFCPHHNPLPQVHRVIELSARLEFACSVTDITVRCLSASSPGPSVVTVAQSLPSSNGHACSAISHCWHLPFALSQGALDFLLGFPSESLCAATLPLASRLVSPCASNYTHLCLTFPMTPLQQLTTPKLPCTVALGFLSVWKPLPWAASTLSSLSLSV